MTLDWDATVVRSAAPLIAEVDDELVLLDPASRRYFGLDRMGRRIWELLEQPTAPGALCVRLQEEFDVPAETCRVEVLTFLGTLRSAGLIDVGWSA